jgi:hypothetical protein
MAVVGALAQFVAGAALWSLAEYALHRCDMHSRAGRGATAREHRAHHTTLDLPALTPGTWVGAGLVAGVLAIGGRPWVGAGWMAAYVGYELAHRRIHSPGPAHPAPWSRYRRWVGAHHMHHHLVDAHSNYGVTSPLWDVVFRTYRRPRPGVPAGGRPPHAGRNR